jgi:hypothetical protein
VHEQQEHGAARVRARGRAGGGGAGGPVAAFLWCRAIMHAHCAQEHAKA